MSTTTTTMSKHNTAANTPNSNPKTSTIPTAKTTLGVPFLPPAAMSAGSEKIRNRFGRIHRSMAPPPVQILESALSILEHRVLVALCAAGVPDALDESMTVDDLAIRLAVDPARLERLLRYGAARGWLRIHCGNVVPNKVTAFLRSDHPSGWRAWVDFLSIPEVVDAITALDLRADNAPFERSNGLPFFDWMAEHPLEWDTFDRAMAAGGRMHALTLDAAVGWKGTPRICDVGGGTGDLLATLLDLHPEWHGAVFDLPGVVARAVAHERMEHLAGDAFVEVPSGFDSYLLVNVLHDWSDADSVRILGNVARAMPATGRVLIVDSQRRIEPRDEIFVSTDVLMAALTSGGQERTAREFRHLAAEAGLRLVRTFALASGDVAHDLRRAR